MGAKKIEVPADKCSRLLSTAPCTVITTVDEKGRVNAAAFGSYMVISPYVLVAVWPGHETYANIKSTGQFTINVPGRDRLDSIFVVSRDYPDGVNELEKAGLVMLPGISVRPPRVAEYKAHVECVFRREEVVGSHHLVIGEMMAGSCDEDLWVEDDRLDQVKAGVVHVCRYPRPVYTAADGYVQGEATMEMPDEPA